MLPTNPLLNATAPAGPHLPVGLLRQYAAGTLAPAAQHRVEAHTLACPRCADILAGLQQTPPATTDQALAHLQQRLRQRVQAQAAPARYDREAQRNRWLIPQLAAAAALLLGLVAGGWWAAQQRHLATEATEVAADIAPNLPATTAPVPAAAPAAPALPPVAKAPVATSAPATKPLASSTLTPRKRQAIAGTTRFRASAPQATSAPDTTAPLAVAAEAAPAATAPLASVPTPAPPPVDSFGLVGRVAVAAMKKSVEPYAAPLTRMPAAPKVPPTPQGGYSALREKLRREATEFKPEEGERPVSGSVQLRLTIGADGKIEQIRVLHGLRADYDEEAQRLVCEGPGWIPGISGGRRAAQMVDVTVPFQ